MVTSIQQYKLADDDVNAQREYVEGDFEILKRVRLLTSESIVSEKARNLSRCYVLFSFVF